MPLANRLVIPVWLRRRQISPDEGSTPELTVTTSCQHAAVGVLIQLASLVRHADDIFCDLAEECHSLIDRTEAISSKVKAVDRLVRQLDSTEVKIPVGSLQEFAAVTDHHVAKHGFDCDFFTQERRPHCVAVNYARCDPTPVHALRGADMYRKDGQCGAYLFQLWPIALRDVATPLQEGEKEGAGLPPTKRFPDLDLARHYKPVRAWTRPRSTQDPDQPTTDSNLEDGLSKSQPSVLVSVDTTGAGFRRMASLRDRNRKPDLHRKKRRRTVSGVPDNIMHELEQFEKEHRIDRGHHRMYSLDNLDDPVPLDLEERERMMQQFLQDIDAAREEREEEERAERPGKLLSLLPCRRSRSLPRSVGLRPPSPSPDETHNDTSTMRSRRSKLRRSAKLGLAASLTRLSLYTKKKQPQQATSGNDANKAAKPPPGADSVTGSRQSLGSAGSGAEVKQPLRRSRSGSLLGEKIRALVGGSFRRPRPKSLDFSTVEARGESRGQSPARRSASLGRLNIGRIFTISNSSNTKNNKNKGSNSSIATSTVSTTTTTTTAGANNPATNTTISRSDSTETHVGPGSYYYFESSTLPRAQARKYDFPWDSLPKDWTTSVKLREISRRRKEDRQSSSGNWSQSNMSSNRQSIESEPAGKSGSASHLSTHSQGRDSGRGSPRYFPRSRNDLDPGYMGDIASTESMVSSNSAAGEANTTKQRVESRAKLGRQDGDRPEVEGTADVDSQTKAGEGSCSGDEWLRLLAERAACRVDVTSTSAEALAELSRLTRQNIRNLDLLVPGRGGASTRGHRGRRRRCREEDEESVYSVDQEGFYTSFHSDSGLRRDGLPSPNDGVDDDLLLLPKSSNSSSPEQVVNIFTVAEVHDTCEVDNGSEATDTKLDILSTTAVAKSLQHNDFVDVDGKDNRNGFIKSRSDNKKGDMVVGLNKKSTKSAAPPPPPRSSSIKQSSGDDRSSLVGQETGQLSTPKTANKGMTLNNSSNNNNSSGSNSSIATSGSPEVLQHSPTYPDDASLCSDQESVGLSERVKLKTSISVAAFPSWSPAYLSGMTSDDDEDSQSGPLSASHERLHAEASELSQIVYDRGLLVVGNGSNRRKAWSPVAMEDMGYPANSWPRGGKTSTPFMQPGILKTPEKNSIGKTMAGNHHKALVFDPIVNMFDPQAPCGVKMPLSRLSSSEESSSGAASDNKGDNQEVNKGPTGIHRSRDDIKYVDEGEEIVDKGLNKHLSPLPGDAPQRAGSIASLTSSISLDATPGRCSSLSGSCSTIALSDTASLTRVSLQDSTLSLTWDSEGYSSVDGDSRRQRLSGKGSNPDPSFSNSELSLAWDSECGGGADSAPAASRLQGSNLSLSSSSSMFSLTMESDMTYVSNAVDKSTINTDHDVPSSSSTPKASHQPLYLRSQPPTTSALPGSIRDPPTPRSSDSTPSSASQTPTLTPNPAHIPPMQPIRANYIPSNLQTNMSEITRHSDRNNNKTTNYFRFPETQPSSVPSFNSHAHPIPTSSWSSHQPNNESVKRKSDLGPVSADRYSHSDATENDYSRHQQRVSEKRQEFRNSHQGYGTDQSSPYASKQQQQPELNNTTPKLLQAARLPHKNNYNNNNNNNSKNYVNNINNSSTRNNYNSNNYSPSSSQESTRRWQRSGSVNSHGSNGSDSQEVLTPRQLQPGSSSESLQSCSSAGRSDSYRVALMSEVDQATMQGVVSSPVDKATEVRSRGQIDRHRQPSPLTSASPGLTRSCSKPPSPSLNLATHPHHPSLKKSLSEPGGAPNTRARNGFTSAKPVSQPNNTNINSYGNRMNRSISTNQTGIEKCKTQVHPDKNSPSSIDVASRADSYRCAMQLSQAAFLASDPTGRSCSYRRATRDADDDDDDGIVVQLGDRQGNGWAWPQGGGGAKAGNRDPRRMGITDVDQLKSADTQHARKRFGVKPELNSDPKRSGRWGQGGGNAGTSGGGRKQRKPSVAQTSSYIRFDPIFESGEDLQASRESMLDDVDTKNMRSRSRSPSRKRSGSQGRRSTGSVGGESGSFSLLGSIKTTFRSIASSKGE